MVHPSPGGEAIRKNTEDKTLYRNYVQKWKFLIQEYELVKQKRHPTFRFVADCSLFSLNTGPFRGEHRE